MQGEKPYKSGATALSLINSIPIHKSFLSSHSCQLLDTTLMMKFSSCVCDERPVLKYFQTCGAFPLEALGLIGG